MIFRQDLKEALADTNHEIKMNGVVLSKIRYAGETLIMCASMDGFQQIINKIKVSGTDMGLNINLGKTKFMTFSCEQHEDAQLTLKNFVIGRLLRFKYLGSRIICFWDVDAMTNAMDTMDWSPDQSRSSGTGKYNSY